MTLQFYYLGIKCCVTDRCTLCCVTAEIDPIYQHLVGAKHRTKYIKNILGQPVHTKDDIKWYAEENDNKNPKQMRIIQSDSEYESVMPQTQLEKEKQQYNDILVHTFQD